MNKKDEKLLGNLLLTIGGIWLLTELFKTPKQAGISGLPNAQRTLMPFINSRGIDEINKDLLHFDRNEIGEIIRLIVEGRLRPELGMPLWKRLKGTKISGELRQGQWRILVYIVNENKAIMLSVFKKKTNETPKSELLKAETRLAEYLNNQS